MTSQIFEKGKEKFSSLIKNRWVSIFVSLGMILLTGGILGYLLYQQREALFEYRWRLNWPFLAGAVALHGSTLLIGAFVWAEMINVLGPQMEFQRHLRYFCLNMLARRLPGTVWYVVYRAQTYNRFGLSVKITTLASGIELAIVLVSGVLTTILFAIPIIIKLSLSPWLLILILVVCAAFLNPPVLKWLTYKLSKEQVQVRYPDLVKWIFMYTISWILGGSILFLIINFFYILPVSQISYVIGCWALVGAASQALVFLPSNFGFGEASLSLLLSQLIPSSLAVVIVVASRLILIIFEIFWAVLSLLYLKTETQ